MQGTSLAENQLNLPNESNENRKVDKYIKTGENAKLVHSTATENNNFEVMEKCKMSSQSVVMNDNHPLIMISPEFQSVILQILRDAPSGPNMMI